MNGASPDRRNAALAGAAIGGVAVAALALLASAAQAVSITETFVPLALAQWLVRRAPGWLDTLAIERLGHAALPLVAIATAAGLIVAGMAVGAIIGWWRGPRHAGDDASFPIAADRSVGRRHVLIAAAAAAVAGMALGLLGPGGPWRRRATPEVALDALTFTSRAVLPLSDAGDVSFGSIDGLTPVLTPVEDFYVVDEALADPFIDPDSWRLAMHGDVERSLQWSLGGLLALPAVERYQTLECISNPVGGPLISTTKWTGVPLARLLEAAGPRPDAIEVVFRSADGYAESLPMSVALHPDTLIAYGMDGRALSVAHGFPARLLSTGTYGMKNPKWLQDIELVRAPFDGFWETRGWSKAAVVKSWTRIDTPVSGRRGSGATIIAGVAFAGDRGISRVDVSTDDGATWDRADTETALSPLTWVRWTYPWQPAGPGLYTIRSRAWDGNAVVQTDAFAPEHPDGASGYPVIAFTVDAV